MGNEQSSESTARSKYSEKYSKEQVDLLLERQKIIFEEKLKVSKASQDKAAAAAAQATAREEARKEVERIMRQKQESPMTNCSPQASSAQNSREEARKEVERIMRQKQESSMTNCSPQASSAQDSSIERNRTPYSFSRNDLQIGVASPTSVNLYPNLNNGASTSQGTFAHSMATSSSTLQAKNVPTTLTYNSRFAPSAPAARDRSVSRTRNSNTRSENQELNCPTCRETFSVYIYQCMRGHSSCSGCKEMMRPCGICSSAITNMRNITLESYVSERKVRCPNSLEGCCLSFKVAELDEHLKECPYREMTCPLLDIFGQCSWKGKLQQLAAHFDNVHQMHRIADVDTEMYLFGINNDNKIVHFITIGTFNFLFHVFVSNRDKRIYMGVQLIGTNHSAEKWTYEVHVFNKREPRRKYQYSDTCSSNSIPFKLIYDTGKCATMPMEYAKTFVNEGNLIYKFYIKRSRDEGKPEFVSNRRGRGARTRR